MKIQIINGPNLNLIGIREPQIYGSISINDYVSQLKTKYPDVQIDAFQSNVEGEIITKIHEVGFSYDGIILNAGAYTHTSIAIADAIAGIKTPVIEVHISNVLKRENFRHVSLIAPQCRGIVMGFGLESYHLALLNFIMK